MTNQSRSPFLALLKLEVLRCSSIYGNPLAWILWTVLMGCSVAPALVLWLDPENLFVLLVQEVWGSMMMFWWVFYLIGECSNSLVRGVWGFLAPLGFPPNHNSDEFLSTRAIDRSLHFRAKTTMLAVFLVLPMVLNFILICVVTRQYPPGISSFVDAPVIDPYKAPRVAVVTTFGWAMIWLSTATIVLAQGYYGLLATLVAQRGTIRALVMASVPVLVAIAGFGVFRLSFAWEHDRIAPVVQFIVRHGLLLTLALAALAVPIQRFCERRFADQEVL